MAHDERKEACDLGTGYRVLDVKCARIEEKAEAEAPDTRAPATVQAAPVTTAFPAPVVLPRRRFVSERRLKRIHYSRATATQVAAVCHKRPSWIKEFVRTERTPLLLALTGVAMSAFLAMLFSILEPRTSSLLSARDAGNPATSFSGDTQRHGSSTAAREGGTPAVILILKAIVVFFPAMLGLGILLASLLRRLARAGRTVQEMVQVTLPVETPGEAKHRPQQSVTPPAGQMRRAA
jgi:hypothetical protein